MCPPDNQSSKGHDLIIVVKSGVGEFNRRKEFRRLYPQLQGLQIGLVFSIGLPRRQLNNKFRRGDRLVRFETNANVAEEITKGLREELETHSDLILGDYEDTYFNLSLKTQFTFTWAATFCRNRRPIFLFLDDDVPFSEKGLLRSLLALNNTQRQSLLHGVMISRGRVLRFEDKDDDFEKWSLLKSEIPWPEYPPYLHGGFLLVSFSQVEKIALGMLFTQRFPIEDAWLGMVAIRLGLRMHLIDDIMSRFKIFTRKPVYLNQIDKKFLRYH